MDITGLIFSNPQTQTQPEEKKEQRELEIKEEPRLPDRTTISRTVNEFKSATLVALEEALKKAIGEEIENILRPEEKEALIKNEAFKSDIESLVMTLAEIEKLAETLKKIENTTVGATEGVNKIVDAVATRLAYGNLLTNSHTDKSTELVTKILEIAKAEILARRIMKALEKLYTKIEEEETEREDTSIRQILAHLERLEEAIYQLAQSRTADTPITTSTLEGILEEIENLNKKIEKAKTLLEKLGYRIVEPKKKQLIDEEILNDPEIKKAYIYSRLQKEAFRDRLLEIGASVLSPLAEKVGDKVSEWIINMLDRIIAKTFGVETKEETPPQQPLTQPVPTPQKAQQKTREQTLQPREERQPQRRYVLKDKILTKIKQS